MGTKTITVAFQLRVPSEMRVSDIDWAIAHLLSLAPRQFHEDRPASQMKLYKSRVEVFAP